MSGSYVVIDSRHGTGTTSAKFEYNLSRPVNKVKEIELLSANIPTAPSVVEDWNDIVYFFTTSDGATIQSADLTPGYYTPDEFINMLNDVMTTASSATFTSTYDANTNKFTLIADENVELAILSDVEGVANQTTLNIDRWKRFTYIIGQNGRVAQSASTSTELAFEWQPKSVRYYTVIIEANGFGNNDMIDHNSYFTFCVPTTNDNLFGFERFRSNSGFNQISNISNVNVKDMTIYTYFEDDLVQLFDFAGKDIEYIVRMNV